MTGPVGHGASLGFGVRDDRRAAVLADPDRLDRHVAGGLGRKFQGRSTPLLAIRRKLLDLAR